MTEVEMTVFMFRGMITELPKETQEMFHELKESLIDKARARLLSEDDNTKLAAIAAYMELMSFIIKELDK